MMIAFTLFINWFLIAFWWPQLVTMVPVGGESMNSSEVSLCGRLPNELISMIASEISNVKDYCRFKTTCSLIRAIPLERTLYAPYLRGLYFHWKKEMNETVSWIKGIPELSGNLDFDVLDPKVVPVNFYKPRVSRICGESDDLSLLEYQKVIQELDISKDLLRIVKDKTLFKDPSKRSLFTVEFFKLLASFNLLDWIWNQYDEITQIESFWDVRFAKHLITCPLVNDFVRFRYFIKTRSNWDKWNMEDRCKLRILMVIHGFYDYLIEIITTRETNDIIEFFTFKKFRLADKDEFRRGIREALNFNNFEAAEKLAAGVSFDEARHDNALTIDQSFFQYGQSRATILDADDFQEVSPLLSAELEMNEKALLFSMQTPGISSSQYAESLRNLALKNNYTIALLNLHSSKYASMIGNPSYDQRMCHLLGLGSQFRPVFDAIAKNTKVRFLDPFLKVSGRHEIVLNAIQLTVNELYPNNPDSNVIAFDQPFYRYFFYHYATLISNKVSEFKNQLLVERDNLPDFFKMLFEGILHEFEDKISFFENLALFSSVEGYDPAALVKKYLVKDVKASDELIMRFLRIYLVLGFKDIPGVFGEKFRERVKRDQKWYSETIEEIVEQESYTSLLSFLGLFERVTLVATEKVYGSCSVALIQKFNQHLKFKYFERRDDLLRLAAHSIFEYSNSLINGRCPREFYQSISDAGIWEGNGQGGPFAVHIKSLRPITFVANHIKNILDKADSPRRITPDQIGFPVQEDLENLSKLLYISMGLLYSSGHLDFARMNLLFGRNKREREHNIIPLLIPYPLVHDPLLLRIIRNDDAPMMSFMFSYFKLETMIPTNFVYTELLYTMVQYNAVSVMENGLDKLLFFYQAEKKKRLRSLLNSTPYNGELIDPFALTCVANTLGHVKLLPILSTFKQVKW